LKIWFSRRANFFAHICQQKNDNIINKIKVFLPAIT